MKKSIFKSIALAIGGLLSLSFLFGTGLSSQFINKKDNNNPLLETSANNQIVKRNSINTEGTKLPSSGGTLSSGTYYLDSDMTLSNYITAATGNNIIINLNGFSLSAKPNVDQPIVYVKGGTLTINGKDDASGNMGTLCNGRGYYDGSYTRGGAVAIYADGTNMGNATINDCNIANNTANFAGAIFVSAGTTGTLNNCNVYNNDSTSTADWGLRGTIYAEGVSSTVNINGGEIYNNEGGVLLWYDGNKNRSSYANINGAYIHDNNRFGVRVNGTDNGNPALTIAGDTIIKNNPSASSTAPVNLRLNGSAQAKFAIASALSDNAYIGVTINGTKGVFTASADTSLNDVSKFFSDDANYAVAKNSDGQLYLTNGAATVTSGETVTEYPSFTQAVSAWNSAASGATLTLLKDTTIDSSISVSTTKTFDLNGCGINANGGNFPIFTANNGSDLTINDSGSTTHYYTLADVESNGAAFATICDEATYEAAAADARGTFTGGYLTGANPSVKTGEPYPGCGIYILQNGVATMNGGTIIGNIAPNCSGGVGSYGKFTMNDGNIIYNRSRRGVLLANAGEMTINGGHISYNTGRDTEYCGTSAVLIYGNCTSFLVNGGYITNNFTRYAGLGSNIPTISISGNPVIKDNIGCGVNGTDTTEINTWLTRGSSNVYLDVVGELTEGAEIGVTIQNISTRGVITNSSDISYNDESKFFSDDANYSIAKNSDGQLYLINAVATVTSGETVTEYSNFNEALSSWNSAASGATLTLLKDVTMSSAVTISNTRILDLNGYGINASGISSNTDYAFLVNNGGNLTLNDSGDITHYFTHERYKGYDAGLATICNKATYDAASEDSRGTFEGGYLTGLSIIKDEVIQGGFFKIEENSSVTMNGGTIIGIYADYSSSCVCSNGTFIMNDGNMIYNVNARGCINARAGILTINCGNISHNTDKNSKNSGRTAALWLNNINNPTYTIRGGTITNNVAVNGAVNTQSDIAIEGNPVIKDNIGVGEDENSDAPMNIVLSMGVESKLNFIGEYTGSEPLGVTIYMDDVFDVTNSADVSFNNRKNVVSDNPNYAIGVYPAGHTKAGQLFIGAKVSVTYENNGHGTAPDSETMASGSVIEPTSPSEEGYVFKGWYKDEEFENAWDFATDTVTSDTILYAKWFDVATDNVIKLINDIGDLTYDGGANDSLDDIVAAKTAYDALTPSQQAIVDKETKDVLDYDILTYRHVDNVGDLIKEIPEPSDSQEYYDAVDTALAAYNALTEEEKAILNADLNFQYKKTLDDNVAIKEVIELIEDIGDVTYNGGQDDSKDDINDALDAYNDLTEEQKNIVDDINKDVLDDAKDTYDKVDETVKLIESIGDVNHGDEDDSKDEIAAARDAYDSLSEEEQTLVNGYQDSYKTLDDDEHVYIALEYIDNIGNVEYSSETEEAINQAREYYDSLTEDQKAQVGEAYLATLTNAEKTYLEKKQSGDILFYVLIIVASLTLVGGIIFLCFLIKKKRSDDDDQDGDNSKRKPLKAYSFGGLVTFSIFVSHYFDAKYIALYVLASLAILVWIACLIVALTIKRKKAIKEEIKPQQVKEIKPQENNEDEEEVETITDENGNIFQIRFIKSFTAKLIQSPIETKKYYEVLKNEVLSYKGTHSRISWHCDSVNAKRNHILKFAIRGKTLCVYLPLDSEKLEDKYKVEKAESKRYEDVSCLYRIKNDRRCGYAKDLIAIVASNLGLEKGEEQHEVYSNLPYEENKPLIARGLIKELKVKVNKPVESAVVLESKVNSEGDEVVLTKDSNGNLFEIRYIKSFTAKLSQSEAEVKDYYTILKNYVLSYKGVHSRISWHHDAINVGRDYILKFAIRGKTLCVYFALDASKLDKKYKVEEGKGNRYIEVPCLYRIKNGRRCEYAKELIDLLMKEHGLKQGDIPNEDYHIQKESTKELLAKGLIKETKHKVKNQNVITHYESITVSKADEMMSDEKAEASIEEVEVNKHKEGSKGIINIDTLSENYNNGDEVTLDSMIEKGLVPSKVGYIKVLARGELNKKLHVVANEYSLQAIKMIVLVGGSVKKVK